MGGKYVGVKVEEGRMSGMGKMPLGFNQEMVYRSRSLFIYRNINLSFHEEE